MPEKEMTYRDTIDDGMSYMHLYDHFYFSPADKNNPKKLEMLEQVWNWAALNASKRRTNPIGELTRLEATLGEPEIGVTKLEQVWRYIQVMDRVFTAPTSKERAMSKATLKGMRK